MLTDSVGVGWTGFVEGNFNKTINYHVEVKERMVTEPYANLATHSVERQVNTQTHIHTHNMWRQATKLKIDSHGTCTV